MVHFGLLYIRLLGIGCCLASLAVALRLALGSPPRRWEPRALLTPPLTLAGTGLALLILDGLFSADWVHMFWTSQVSMVSLFLASGGLLRAEERLAGSEVGWLRLPPFTFAGLVVAIGALPLFFVPFCRYYAPENHPGGGPLADLSQIFLWGFGGALPEALLATSQAELDRGLGHLQRWTTVPLGTTLIAAWLCIGYALVGLAGRALLVPRWRSTFYLLAPTTIALLVFAAARTRNPGGAFDPRLFGQFSARATGVWTTEACILRSYGPVLVLALGLTLALHLVRLAERRARAGAPATEGSAPRGSTAAS